MAKSRWKEIEDLIRARGAESARKIDPRQVETAEWVRMKCRFGCGGYDSCLTCPPHSPTPQETRRLLDGYTVGFLIHWGSKSGGREALAAIERDVFLMGFHKAFAMASGPCELCDECAFEEGCRHPYEARPSMEACGIDVFKTARDAGFPIEVVRTRRQKPNFYSLLLVE